LDDIIPKQSEIEYRYQKITDKKLYDIYQREIMNGDLVSKTFFIYSIVTKEKIRHSKSRKFYLL
jgi:hypothetical protein